MVEMHEMIPGKRFDRYHELGQHAFGEKLGLWIVVPQQLICEVGLDIVYMVTGGKSLQKIHDLVCQHRKDCKNIKTTYDLWFCSFCAVSPSQLQYHLWHILGCSNHVSQVINQQLKSTSQLNQPSY